MGNITSRSDQLPWPTARFDRCAMLSMTPVRCSVALRMNMAATVMAASLLKTRNASVGFRIHGINKLLKASIATMPRDSLGVLARRG